jgi:hypothetical protein
MATDTTKRGDGVGPPAIPIDDLPPPGAIEASAKANNKRQAGLPVALLSAAQRVVKKVKSPEEADADVNDAVTQFVSQTLKVRSQKRKSTYGKARKACSDSKKALTAFMSKLCEGKPLRSKEVTLKLQKDASRWPASAANSAMYVQYCDAPQYTRGFETDVLVQALQSVDPSRVRDRVKKAPKTKPITLDDAFVAEVGATLPKVRGTRVPSIDLRESAQVKLTKQGGDFPVASDELMDLVERRLVASYDLSVSASEVSARKTGSMQVLIPRRDAVMDMMVKRGLSSYSVPVSVRREGKDGEVGTFTRTITVQRKKKEPKKLPLNATWVKKVALPPCVMSAGGFRTFEEDKSRFITVFQSQYMPMFIARQNERVVEPGETLVMRESAASEDEDEDEDEDMLNDVLNEEY